MTLAQVGRHRGLAETGDAIILDSGKNHRSGGPGVRCHREDMLQLQLIGAIAELKHSAALFTDDAFCS